MPRFFFDIHEDGVLSADLEGTVLAELDRVPAEARRLLLDLARDHRGIPAGVFHLQATVRLIAGPVFHWSTLVLDNGASDSEIYKS